MGELKVEFLGICTNIIDPDVTGVPHRVVLINAKKPGVGIAPHLATLRVYTNDIVHVSGPEFPRPSKSCMTVFHLHGVTLTIGKTAKGHPRYDHSFLRCTPKLTCLTLDLDSLSRQVVRDHRPARAACYFDLTGGELSARTNRGGAVRSILTTRTSTKHVKIHCTPFVKGKDPSTLTLRSGSRIVVANVPVNTCDDKTEDFLLHYRVFKILPQDARIPSAGLRCISEPERLSRGQEPLWPRCYDTTNAGCSCSEYP